MGNNLCAPLLRKGYHTNELPYLNKDSHLLRLWAEIFRVYGDGDYMRWERVSDDIVPINIICVQAHPNTIFQITAYNRQVEKIFSAKLIQPGTIICPATESFVHWRDSFKQCEWGLNFSCSSDAKKFRECCMTIRQKYSRKASSASSLRLSPPSQRLQNAEASQSSPNSPTAHHRQSSHDATINSQTTPFDATDSCTLDNHTPERTRLADDQPKSTTLIHTCEPPSSSSSVYDDVNTAVVKRVAFAEQPSPGDSCRAVSLDSPHAKKVTVINNGFERHVTFTNKPTDAEKQSNADLDNDSVFVDHTEREKASAYSYGSVAHPTLETHANLLGVEKTHRSINSTSSESPEWPAPPEPLTPQTPLNPCHIDFDSETLMRLLRCLPADRSNIFSDYPGNDATIPLNATMYDHHDDAKDTRVDEDRRNKPAIDQPPSDGATQSTVDSSAPPAGEEKVPDTAPIRSIQQSMEALNRIEELPDVSQYVTEELSDEEVEVDQGTHTMTECLQANQTPAMTGATRKAGWLVVKNWLVPKKRKLEMASRRSWHKYWVCLKGVSLLFYDRDEGDMLKYNLVIDGGLAQSVPEHPKRSNVFSLSSAFGYAYLFQANSISEVNSWIDSIHNACASSFARQHGKDNTLILLKAGLRNLETNITMEKRMMKMGELQLSIVSEPKSCQAIVNQINQWYENLEHMNVDHFRLRCYASSLQSMKLPNPKVLLGSISRISKNHLSRLGVFTVASFHALVCARSPKAPLIQNPSKTSPNKHKANNSTDITKITMDSKPSAPDCAHYSASPTNTECLSRVGLPDGQTVTVCVDDTTTVQDLLRSVCNKRQLNARDHFVKFKVRGTGSGTIIPDTTSIISKQVFDSIEVSRKYVYQMDLTKGPDQPHFGFFIEAELEQDSDREDELCVYICDIQQGSIAEAKGLMVGDEILMINRKVVSDLDMVYVETLLHSSRNTSLMVRSCRTHRPYSTFMAEHDDKYLSKLVCQPPPSQNTLSHQQLTELTVPAPTGSTSGTADHSPMHPSQRAKVGVQIKDLLQVSDHVTELCRTPSPDAPPTGSPSVTKPLSDADKLRKIIIELLETERAYVKDMNCLIERYLEPLKEESFMTSGEIHQLFGNIREIVHFQQHFLQSLEEAVKSQPKFHYTNDIAEFKDILYLLGTSFLYYANHFKVYSSFCASHSRSRKILDPERNSMLREFLQARNPKQQHSATLESLLIKPIQRIVRYPLLLQQICNMTNKQTHEHYQLVEALRGMEAVAEHINEMQKIYDEYGNIFDDLSRQHQLSNPHNMATDLSVGELQMYGTVEWLNAVDTIGKLKKATQLDNILFVFRMAVVFLCHEHIKRKRPKSNSRTSTLEGLVTVQRYHCLIPVHELKVRYTSMCESDTRHWWDLVHLRSETLGRPEKVYNFCNNTIEAKSDFLRIIRQIIRDSVRRVATTRSSEVTFGPVIIPPEPPQKPAAAVALDYELATQTFSENDSNEDSNSYTTTSEGQTLCSTSSQSQSSSNSNISGSSHSESAARLVQSSAHLHAAGLLRERNGAAASPIWRLRDNERPVSLHETPLRVASSRGAATLQASVYGDCAEIVYRNDNVLVMSDHGQTVGTIEQFKDDDTL